MANIYPLDRDYTISTVDHGNTLVLGNSSLGDRSGGWQIEVAPQLGFQGSILVVGRSLGQQASDDNLGFLAVPYRTINIGGTVSDYSFTRSQTGVALSQAEAPFIIQVPANGLSIGLTITCTTGTARLYSQAVTTGTAV